ncbi:MAG: hypothetical protein MUD08_17355 [Cytophagales bacterium]|jgi:hypothetical protein|nr:hypothetical protein [Cytophagales bacterium]
MKKFLLLLTAVILCIGCQNTENKQTATDSLSGFVQEEKLNEPKIKYLSATNGGLLAFLDNGNVTACPRCDLTGGNVKNLVSAKPDNTYREFPSFLLLGQSDTLQLFENGYGAIANDWKIFNHCEVDFKEMVTNYRINDNALNRDSVQVIDETCFVHFPPETKTFADENSPEAEAYFTAMDDWSYYMNETNQNFAKAGVKSVAAEKRFLLFKRDTNEEILVDTKDTQLGMKISALVYRKGKMPLVVNLVDNKMEICKKYLGK